MTENQIFLKVFFIAMGRSDFKRIKELLQSATEKFKVVGKNGFWRNLGREVSQQSLNSLKV